ncbi:hypothetical protein [Paenibacillus sp. NPDC058071]|uniref:hypothetical protein n=1 Tax=Paenibacillus sp. NPDC058071 TaxID=3346326 RepID=UPI0036DAC2F0
MFELHDLIPYFLSISVICSFAYAAYFTRPSFDAGLVGASSKFIRVPLIPLVQQSAFPDRILHWLVRRLKRKESPDGESADCMSSFTTEMNRNERGGLDKTWNQTRHSPLFTNIAF